MSSLEAAKPSPLYVAGKNYLDVFLVFMVADDAYSLCMYVGGVMVVRIVQFVNQR